MIVRILKNGPLLAMHTLVGYAAKVLHASVTCAPIKEHILDMSFSKNLRKVEL